MRTPREWQLAGLGLATLWLVTFVVLDLYTPSTAAIWVSMFPLAALIACAVLPASATAAFAVAAVIAAVTAGWWDRTWATETGVQLERVGNAVLVAGVAVVIAAVRVRRERELERMSVIAAVAQRAILPKIPGVVGPVAVAARYLSATDDAHVGGDLYDFCHERGTTRLVIGDVRGKGLDAVEQAARVIRAYRQYASSMADLPEVAKSMSSYLTPFLDAEEFVTALLVDASDPEWLTLVSCGHPQPMLVEPNGEVSLLDLPAGLPLGLGDAYQANKVPWRSGDQLLMYTDGLSEARDAKGRFFSPTTLADLIAQHDVEQALEGTLDAVRRHVPAGRLNDDLAVLLLKNLGGTDTPVTEIARSEKLTSLAVDDRV